MKIMIQSTNSSVLKKFKEKNKYELVYMVDEFIRDALNSTIADIKNFAHSVVIQKPSIYPKSDGFITGVTDVVPKLHASKLPVYVQLFSNEFLFQAWDFFSDANVEINTFVQASKIDGIITDFPKTAASYRRNRCLGLGANTPAYMQPVQPGLKEVLVYQPPAEAPYPVLTNSDVNEPPLPSVTLKIPTSDGGGSAVLGPTSPSKQPKLGTCIFLSTLAMLLAILQPL